MFNYTWKRPVNDSTTITSQVVVTTCELKYCFNRTVSYYLLLTLYVRIPRSIYDVPLLLIRGTLFGKVTE